MNRTDLIGIPIEYFLLFSFVILLIGICGIILNRKSLINILFSMEIIILSSILNFIAFSRILNDITGQIFAIFILTTAAAEAAIALSILLIFFKKTQSIDIEKANELKE